MPRNRGERHKQNSARKQILEFLLANIGRIIEGEELRVASGGISEWARRVRELRDEYGYHILSYRDRADLRQGQYLMETAECLPVSVRDISKETRAFVFNRDGGTCQLCGRGADNEDLFIPGRKIRLTIGHIVDKSKGGSDHPDNLRAECTNCNEGNQDAALMPPDRRQLFTQIRRATKDDQRAILEWLQKKFAVSE